MRTKQEVNLTVPHSWEAVGWVEDFLDSDRRPE